ncbi:MAG: hypothetical protein AAF789_09955, partial [Bacteroidota bacterium]
ISTSIDRLKRTGFTADPNEQNFTNFPSLAFTDIESFYEKNIKGKPVVMSIYGDASRFDKDKLATFGKIIELDYEDVVTE